MPSLLLQTSGERLGEIYHSNQSKEEWATTNTEILITDVVGGRDLGMVMVFCHPDQARIEACDSLSALHQHDSSEPSMVVVRRYSNTPYIPRGMSHALYLDMGTFSRAIASTHFPLDRLHLCWLHPFSESEVLLPHEVGEEGLKDISSSPRVPTGWFRGGTPSF